MSNKTKSTGSLIAAALGGAVITYTGFLFLGDSTSTETGAESAEKKPLYWVAPMDANYRRDKPGKSPMGMDLIPVYDEGDAGTDTGPGTIRISPEMVNNLGVRTATAEYRQLDTRISTVGYVKYNEDKLVHIHPRVEGWVEKLHVKSAGDPVEAQQALYDIYSPALVNAQEELLLALDRNNQRLIRAAEDRLHALQFPEQVIKQLKKDRQVMHSITFYAPQAGVIDELNIREGFFVKPGVTLMSIGQLDEVWVEAEIFERQAAFVEVGIPVTMTLDYQPAYEWGGEVDYIYPTLDPKTRTLKVRLRFENEDYSLKPNMFAQVVIHPQTEEETLLVPREAIIRSGTRDRLVLALGEGRYKSIYVDVGRYDNNSAEILSGLEAGDVIVTSAQFLLDSESSKNSDFKRMHFQSEEEEASSVPDTVWTEATIHSLMPEHRMATVTHQPIEDWNWPEMTMDFMVSESVDMSQLAEDMTLHVEIGVDEEGNYTIINIHIPDMAMEMEHDHSADHAEEQAVAETVWTGATINSLMADHRMVNVTHQAIEAWDWPEMTMNFMVAESVDMDQLRVGMNLHIEIGVNADGDYEIVNVHIPDDQIEQEQNND